MKNLIFVFILIILNNSLSFAANCKITNPYSDGSGHYAGFEWAKNKSVSSCGGKSNSFIGGCEEYLSQIENCEK